jgi:serine/threonine-protein kinase
MLSRLNHPQIAKFIDLFVEDHRAYVVMELVEGQSLKELVASEGPLPEKAVVDLATQIAEILTYLHSQDPPVIHRDLTPDNIMLGEDGLAKLIDFSVAQEASSGVTGSVVGKPNYISPEQFRGKPTPQSDLYSLGATMFFLLTGVDPPPISVLHPKAEKDKISHQLDTIVARCTQLDVSKRIESAEQVLVALRALG